MARPHVRVNKRKSTRAQREARYDLAIMLRQFSYDDLSDCPHGFIRITCRKCGEEKRS